MYLNSIDMLKCGSFYLSSGNEPEIVEYGIYKHYHFSKEKLSTIKKPIVDIFFDVTEITPYKFNIQNLCEKDGKRWNNLETIQDYDALDFFLALGKACGIIKVNFLKEFNAIGIIGPIGEQLHVDYSIMDQESFAYWSEIMKTKIFPNIFFEFNLSMIREKNERLKRYELSLDKQKEILSKWLIQNNTIPMLDSMLPYYIETYDFKELLASISLLYFNSCPIKDIIIMLINGMMPSKESFERFIDDDFAERHDEICREFLEKIKQTNQLGK